MATTVTLKPNAIDISGSTSGTTTLQATAVAGTTTLTLPAATDTLVGRATTDTLTNKTLTGAAMNGTLGATTPSTGAFTTLTSTGASSFATSSGNVGIGTGSPSVKLDVLGGSIRVNEDSIGTKIITMRSNYAGVGPAINVTTNDPLLFLTNDTERARFNSTGALVFNGGTTTADGIGITFPATQSASSNANTLDDYEEGTWTPVVAFGGGTTGITYTTQLGQYTKIGRQVTVTANVTLSSKGSSTGDATLTGLPFTNTTTRSVGSIYLAQITFADSPSILVESSNTIAYFRETTNAGVATDLTNADFANNSNWTATITYFV